MQALGYVLCVLLLAVVSAALLDALLRAAMHPVPNVRQGSFEGSNPWLIVGLGVMTVATTPTLLISEYGPPLMLIVYPVFFAHFGGDLVRDYVSRQPFSRG